MARVQYRGAPLESRPGGAPGPLRGAHTVGVPISSYTRPTSGCAAKASIACCSFPPSIAPVRPLFLDNFYLPADQICKAPLRGVMSPTSPIAAGHARCSSGKPRRRPFDEVSIIVIRHGSHQSSPEATVRLHNSPNDKANGNHQLGIKTNHSLT